MKNRVFAQLSAATALTLLFAAVSLASVPAPPVNQNLGIGDISFNNLIEGDCRVCHGPNPPPGVPVDTTYLPDRHHLLVNSAILPNPSVVVPNPDADGDSVPDATFDCLNCHTMSFDTNTGTWELDPDFRDCLVCHVASPHHVTVEAQTANCQACHGSLVDDGLRDADNDGTRNAIDPDGGWVPIYQPSLVTPYPGGAPDNGTIDGIAANVKPNGGMINPINGAAEGNCTYCHDAGTNVPGGEVVQSNDVNHHETGLQTGDKCGWCHSFSDPAEDTPIRTCENCHGIPSVHNIQAKSDGTPADGTITPGAEDPWFGHIGSQDDCNGCHGFTAASVASGSGPVIPQIESITPATATADQPVTLTITGKALTNMAGPAGMEMLQTSDLLIVAADGTETIVAATVASESSMTVDAPALAAGNYTLRAKKYQKISNPIILPVVPGVAVASATCADGSVTISGNGFGSLPVAEDGSQVPAGSSVSATVTVTSGKGKNKTTTSSTEVASIFSWDDSEIVADFSACPATVDVAALFGSASATVDGGAGSSCADNTDEASCSADASCAWSTKKGGSCKEAGGGGGKPPKNK